jgi:NitT/TauT family transport system substrate-binding protein
MKPILQATLMLLAWVGILGAWPVAAKTTLQVGYLPILDHLTLLVSHAHDNALFKDVNIEPRQFKSWDELSGALQAGRIQGAFILAPLAMDLYSHGVAIRCVLLAHRDGSAITVKKDSGIHSAADLRGKSVAIPAWKSTHTALLDTYLRGDGMSLKDIRPEVIAPPNMLQAMRMGQIEAFIVAEPFGSEAQDEGIGSLLVLTRDILPHHVDCIVVLNQEVLQQHPQAVQEWVASLIKAGAWIEQDKNNNRARDVAHLTSKTYLPYSEAVIAGGMEEPVERISFDDLAPSPADLQKIVEISVRAGILKPMSLDGFIDPAPYQQARAAELAHPH